MHSPSGEQLEIAFADQRAVVTEVGAGLRTYSVDGRELLDGYSDREMAPSGRGQVLVPVAQPDRRGALRVRRGATPVARSTSPRRAARSTASSAGTPGPPRNETRTASSSNIRLHPQPGYPFALALEIEYALSEDGLRVSTTATNVGDEPCPYGAGAHPYLCPGTPTVDTAILRVPARTVLDVGPVDGTEFDFRSGRPVGGTRLDHCFTDLERDDDGLARVTLGAPRATRASRSGPTRPTAI